MGFIVHQFVHACDVRREPASVPVSAWRRLGTLVVFGVTVAAPPHAAHAVQTYAIEDVTVVPMDRERRLERGKTASDTMASD